MNIYQSRFNVRLKEFQRRFVRFFGGLSTRDFEYEFVYRHVVGGHGKVLDIGGSESLLPFHLARRGYSVTVLDFREYPEQHPNLSIIQGDFLTNNIPDNSFDFIVMVSTIEHIGFGSYGAPEATDGDLYAIAQAKRILKPSGKIVITFPFASKEHIVSGFERWYDITRVKVLFEGLHVLVEEYYIPQTIVFNRVVKWLPASLEQITNTDDVIHTYGYQCNACYVVSNKPNHFLFTP